MRRCARPMPTPRCRCCACRNGGTTSHRPARRSTRLPTAPHPGVLRHRRIEPRRPDAGAARRLGYPRRRQTWRRDARPRTRFYDNLDARTLELALVRPRPQDHALRGDLKVGRYARDAGADHRGHRGRAPGGTGRPHPGIVLGLTEPKARGATNGLRALCEHFGIPTLDARPQYRRPVLRAHQCRASAGARPRPRCRGVARRAPARVVEACSRRSGQGTLPPRSALLSPLASPRSAASSASVMLPYADRLVALRRLVCAALGREPRQEAARARRRSRRSARSTSTASSSSISTARRSTSSPWCGRIAPARGPRVAPDLAKIAGADYLAGHAAGDLVAAQQRAIPEALMAPGPPGAHHRS